MNLVLMLMSLNQLEALRGKLKSPLWINMLLKYTVIIECASNVIQDNSSYDH